jgi:hypothetical protein
MIPDKLPDTFVVIAKPSSRKTEILGWDAGKKELKVAIAAPAEQNKANIELLKFIRKISGKSVEIVSGLKNKRKIIRIG